MKRTICQEATVKTDFSWTCLTCQVKTQADLWSACNAASSDIHRGSIGGGWRRKHAAPHYSAHPPAAVYQNKWRSHTKWQTRIQVNAAHIGLVCLQALKFTSLKRKQARKTFTSSLKLRQSRAPKLVTLVRRSFPPDSSFNPVRVIHRRARSVLTTPRFHEDLSSRNTYNFIRNKLLKHIVPELSVARHLFCCSRLLSGKQTIRTSATELTAAKLHAS